MAVSNMDRLEAVNVMIGTIGLSPINSLSGNLTSDINSAVTILDETTRNVLAEGWHWNTEEGYPLSPDGNGEIVWPDSFASIDLDPKYNPGDVDLVKRNAKLYDKKNRTYVWTGVVYVTVIEYLEWSDIPQPARNYITISAARVYSNRLVGSGEINAFTEADELRARSTMTGDEASNADYSIFDTYDTAAPLRRTQGAVEYFNQ